MYSTFLYPNVKPLFIHLVANQFQLKISFLFFLKKSSIKMTAANLETNNSSKIESLNENLKPKLLPNKKVYYSDRYIYLDKSEFQIVWHNVALFIFLHTMWFLGLYGILTFDSEFVKCVPICKNDQFHLIKWSGKCCVLNLFSKLFFLLQLLFTLL